jgi:hypothetical protein
MVFNPNLLFLFLLNKTITTMATISFMKTKRIPGFLLLILVLFLSSCLTSPKFKFEGYSDVYMQKKKIGGVDKYLTYYFAYANTTITSAIVATPGTGGTVTLSPFQSDTYTFCNNPSASSFVTSPPTAGNYTFTVTTGDGEVQELTDNLTTTELAVPVITEASFKTSGIGIYIKWNAVSNASAYNVKLFNPAGDLVFASSLIVITKTDILIESTTTGWVTGNPIANTAYRVELHAYKFEEGATDQDFGYNLQCDSYTEASVTWLM